MSEDKVFEDSIQGIREYQEEVMKMSDDELYEYVFDQEYDSEDFESIVLANRGIDLGKVLRAVLKNDPDARFRVRYIDYEDGFWTLPLQIMRHRIEGVENDKSVERVQVMFSNLKIIDLWLHE